MGCVVGFGVRFIANYQIRINFYYKKLEHFKYNFCREANKQEINNFMATVMGLAMVVGFTLIVIGAVLMLLSFIYFTYIYG